MRPPIWIELFHDGVIHPKNDIKEPRWNYQIARFLPENNQIQSFEIESRNN